MRPRISIWGRVRRSVGRSVRPSVCPCVTCFCLTPKMSGFLYENHSGSPTLTSLNVLGVLGVLNVHNVLSVLNVLNMPMDASLACWALLRFSRWFLFLTHDPITHTKNCQTQYYYWTKYNINQNGLKKLSQFYCCYPKKIVYYLIYLSQITAYMIYAIASICWTNIF